MSERLICGECKYWDENDKHTVGCRCHRPNWFWRTNSAMFKQKWNKACKGFVKKEQ